MLRADAQTEVLRRGALFAGAGLLGVQCGAWFHSFGSRFNAEPALAVGIAVVCIAGAFRLRNRLLQAACLALAARNLLTLIPAFRTSAAAPAVVDALTTIVAILFVAAGARKRSRAMLMTAAAVFVLALVFKIAVDEHLRWLLGGRSIMGLELWEW
jgi:hypothetical protein